MPRGLADGTSSSPPAPYGVLVGRPCFSLHRILMWALAVALYTAAPGTTKITLNLCHNVVHCPGPGCIAREADVGVLERTLVVETG